jgi:hypothetical protein
MSGRAAAPTTAVDLLFVPQTCRQSELARILAEGPRLRDGGVLIVQTPDLGDHRPDPFHALLEAHGFQIERCVHGARRELHIARRTAAHPWKKAA